MPTVRRRFRAAAAAGLLALSLVPAAPCRAERDIVYAARYYYPPRGPARASRWHLYRINPDGTGRRPLTRGEHDDFGPVWSPDGRRVAFVRGGGPWGEGRRAVCLVAAAGGPVTTLLTLPEGFQRELQWSPDGRVLALQDTEWNDRPVVRLIDTRTRRTRALVGATRVTWSPDGRRLYVARKTGGDRIEPAAGGNATTAAGHLQFPLWLDNRTIVGIVPPSQQADSPLAFVGVDGRQRRLLHVNLARRPNDRGFNGEADGLLPVPGSARRLVYVLNRHNSTVGVLSQYVLVDLSTGKSADLGDGQFISFAPGGRRFCTAPGRDLGAYGAKRDGAERTVWMAALEVGRVGASRRRVITPGAVWAVGADWRKAGRPAGAPVRTARTRSS